MKKFIETDYLDKDEYVQEWRPSWRDGVGTVLKRVKGWHDADHAMETLTHADRYNLTVFIFERMDESFVLMWDKLNMTVEEGIVPHDVNRRPNPGTEFCPRMSPLKP